MATKRTESGMVPGGTHSSSHEDGGDDEVNVGGLSGDLADPQDPKDHAASHEAGNADALDGTLAVDISGDSDTVDGYDIVKNGGDGAGKINFKT